MLKNHASGLYDTKVVGRLHKEQDNGNSNGGKPDIS